MVGKAKQRVDSVGEGAPTKKQRTDGAPSAPAAVPAVQGSPCSLAGLPPAPSMPTVDAKLIGDEVYHVMREVVPWVGSKLRQLLKDHNASVPAFRQFKNDKVPWEHAPLHIVGLSEQAALVSYKAAWAVAEAQTALAATGMYEAAINIFWLNPFPASDTARVLLGDPPTWPQLQEVVNLHFDTGPPHAPPSPVVRLVFPITVPAHVLSIAAATTAAGFQGSLPAVSGHIYIFAWYLAMHNALLGNDLAGIAALWQCGLTVSTQVRVALSEEELTIWSLQSSEVRKTQERLYSDTFPAFALKALLVGEKQCSDVKRLKFLNDAGVTFNGARVNRPMATTIAMFQDCISKKSVDVMHAIALQHGREVLSGGYTKIARIGQLCSEIAKAVGEQPADLVLYVLECLEYSLGIGTWKPQDMTVAQLDRCRDGPVGLVCVILARRRITAHLQSLVEDIRAIDAAKTVVADLDATLPHFASYPTFKSALGITRSAAPPRQRSEGEDGTLAAPQGQPDALDSVELFKKSHCNTKASFVAVNCLCDLLGGLCDEKLKTLVKNQSFKDKLDHGRHRCIQRVNAPIEHAAVSREREQQFSAGCIIACLAPLCL